MGADRSTSIDGSQIRNLTIKPEDMKRTGNAPTDGLVLSYDNATELFKWIAGVGGAHSIVDDTFHTDKADYIDIPYSPTILTGGLLSEGTNAGTLKVSALTALIRTTDSTTGALTKITLAEQDNQTMTSADIIYYVVLDYNGGSPQILIQEAEPNNNNQIQIGRCIKQADNTVHYRNSGLRLQHGLQKSNQRARLLREWEINEGILISDAGSKHFAISAGSLFRGINEFPFSGFDSSASGEVFTYVYYNGSAWVYVTDQTEIDVDNYNNIATGLTGFTKYKCDWVFIHPTDGHIYVVYGQDDNTIGKIEDSIVPTLPDVIDRFGALVGRIIIDYGVATFYRIEMIQTTTFNPQVVIDHNDNSNIQGGIEGEYYHLSSAEHVELSQWLDNVVLGSDGKLTLPNGTDINEFSIDGTLGDNSDDAVPTEKAVKTYVDSAVPDLSTSVDDFTIKYVNNKLKIADRIELNIMLNFFHDAVDESRSVYNMVDGIVDEFEDESGIDTGASTNEDYDSTNDLYEPSSVGGTIDENTVLMLHCNGADESQVFTDASPSEHGNATVHGNAQVDTTNKKWGTGSLMLDGNSDYLSYPDSADWDICGSNSDDWTVDFWVKHNDHAGTEVYICYWEDGENKWQLWHVDGAGISFWVEVGDVRIIELDGGAEITDLNWHHIAICKVGNKWGIYKNGTQILYGTTDTIANFTGILEIGRSGGALAYLYGYMDEIRIQHSNIFGANPNDTPDDEIDVPTGEYTVGLPSNMTLISKSTTAEAEPDTARLVLFEKPIDAISLNVDLEGYVSIDDGANWDKVTLTSEAEYESGMYILTGTKDVSARTGTDVRWKIETHNNKDVEIRGVANLWD